MFGLQHLFCWVPRRRNIRRERHGSTEQDPGAGGEKRRRRRHIRRYIHAKAGGLGDADGSQAISPVSGDGRLSMAFSDTEYHDAVEWHEGDASFTSRSSADDSHLSSPTGSYADGQQPASPTVFSRLATWWEGRRASGPHQAQGSPGAGDEVTPRSGASHPRSSSVGSPSTPPVPADEIIEPSADGKIGCMSLFTVASAGLAHKKFLRLGKPAAGSSFRSAAEERGGEATPATPPQLHPPPQRQSVVDKLQKSVDEETGSCAAAWEPAEGTTFQVRSHGYMRSKKKEPSGPCMLVGVDVYSFDFKLYHIAQHVQLPEVPVVGPAAQALPADQKLPPLLIINMQLPMYGVEQPAALALVQRFMHNRRELDGTPTRDRFKLIPRIVNVDEWAEKGPLSGYEHRLLMNYNDKPLLTRPQQRFYTGPHYLEIDLDVHSYAFVARKAFHGYIQRLAPVVFENAFVVQGNRPEELPEQVLAAARVYRVDFTKSRPFPAKSLDELGNGTGPAHDGEAARR
ncbi:hypothetical protein CHLNCDRAFT_138257 [Chlorella variabilis]|uniref:Protein ENHANCED DISEASE RESISTANCE 2 C-terminal domain-containing protein n=1 Tax=Chlorella variabilis TaxID=554065 RepID=E1ZMM7_CHLVA|nr:hypothetical protein CHLNCDRAFT_138257 [Chlorella variabilis]EFN52720.1 hypothetical protein CHLNCDRAFT_138257 [Chlorella variabilis]|eukprot:XP_005844822.1 hypothetical protein CHLNCDRAFT_138257 [Chlorella variabilis]